MAKEKIDSRFTDGVVTVPGSDISRSNDTNTYNDWMSYLNSLYPSSGSYEVPTFNYQYQGWSPSAFGYDNSYANKLNATLGQLENFQYDPEKDVSYQAYKKQYTNAGNKAMTDTMAKVAARSGGIASSYANTAAQQSYNAYMQELANKVPELAELNYNRLRNQASTYASLDQDAYTRAYNQWLQNNNWAYNEHQAAENARYNTAKMAYENSLKSQDSDINNRWSAYNNAVNAYNKQLDADNELKKINTQHANELELTRYKSNLDEHSKNLQARLDKENLDYKERQDIVSGLRNTAMEQLSIAASPDEARDIIYSNYETGVFDELTSQQLLGLYARSR